MVVKAYSDKECTKEIKVVGWDSRLVLKLIDGTTETVDSAVEAGDLAIATCYLRNELPFEFAVTDCVLSDERLKYKIGKAKLEFNKPTEMMIWFDAPKNPKPEDVVKGGKIQIRGYYIFKPRL